MGWSQVVHDNRRRAELLRAREELQLRRRGLDVEVCVGMSVACRTTAGATLRCGSDASGLNHRNTHIHKTHTRHTPIPLHADHLPPPLSIHTTPQSQPSANAPTLLLLAGMTSALAWWRREGRTTGGGSSSSSSSRRGSQPWRKWPGAQGVGWLCCTPWCRTCAGGAVPVLVAPADTAV
jgi:hypothetical protein